MNKSYKIEVDCANCANLIETAINKIEGIQQANISFMLQKMKIVFADNANEDAILQEIRKVAKKIEPDFKIL